MFKLFKYSEGLISPWPSLFPVGNCGGMNGITRLALPLTKGSSRWAESAPSSVAAASRMFLRTLPLSRSEGLIGTRSSSSESPSFSCSSSLATSLEDLDLLERQEERREVCLRNTSFLWREEVIRSGGGGGGGGTGADRPGPSEKKRKSIYSINIAQARSIKNFNLFQPINQVWPNCYSKY